MNRMYSVRRYIVVGDERIETTTCWWCTDDYVCSTHADKAKAARQRQQAAKADRRVAATRRKWSKLGDLP